MTRSFTAKMPQRPMRQKHADAHRSDNYGFLRSLDNDEAADCNLRWFWNNPKKKTRESGGLAFGLHNASPAGNGYRWIMDGNHCRPMTTSELHRTEWSVAGVKRWRRGPSARAERPRSQWELYTYVKAHGGTVIGELKSWAFYQYPWIMDELVAKAKDCNHAPWFKALPEMRGCEEKCRNTRLAEVDGVHGSFALIFGKKVKGRAARLRAAKKVTANWAVQPTAVW